ncbi:MAG: hypothetical protein M1376_13210 [Planctomycetes bacterium]|nr:hypothetical protein [Planctomycetota bacterium]
MRTARVSHFGRFLLVLLFPGLAAAQAQFCSESCAPLRNGSWTFGDNGYGAYRLEAPQPYCVQLGTFRLDNPTLLLEVGKRYQVRVVHYTEYPLELIAKGASDARDTVLLSMGSDAGAFAADPEVNWQDDGRGTVRFTLTARLFGAMSEGGLTPGYRSRAQAATMRGDFAVTWMPPLTERIAHAPIMMASARATSGLAALIERQSDRLYAADLRTRGVED